MFKEGTFNSYLNRPQAIQEIDGDLFSNNYHKIFIGGNKLGYRFTGMMREFLFVPGEYDELIQLVTQGK